MSHFSRKSYSNVKVQLQAGGVHPMLLSEMDTTFLFFYAIGSFFSGNIGDKYHSPTVIGIGLIGSGCCVFALVLAMLMDITHTSDPSFERYYLICAWMMHGLFQSVGGPVGTAVMGNWFSSKNRYV